MRCTIVLEFDDGPGTEVKRLDLMQIHRDAVDPAEGNVGLTLAEGKTLSNCVQQSFVDEQIDRFCAVRRPCPGCGVLSRPHDGHCSELKTVLGKINYCRDRWKACKCGADGSRYVSPLKSWLNEVSTGERRWLHAELGATLPHRQAKQLLDLLIPTSGRDSHVTIRKHRLP